MKSKVHFSAEYVRHIAKLAAIPITSNEENQLAKGFNTVIQVIEKLNQLDVSRFQPSNQVTGLSNVFREDVIDKKRMLGESDVLKNAKRQYKGFFVVTAIFEE